MAIRDKEAAGTGGKAPPAAAEMPRQVLEKIVLRRGSLRGLGQQFGRSNMWLWRQVRHNKRIDLAKAEQVLAQLEVPPRFFYEEILDQTAPYDPVWVLEHFRGESELLPDPFLIEVLERLLALLDLTPLLGGARRLAEIDRLDEFRFFDRGAAKRALEMLIREILGEVERTAPRRAQLADCAHLMLIWGAVQRARGHRDDCTDAYRLAYRLALKGRDPRPLGIFYYYGSHLLSMEFDQPAHALRFAEQACAIFQQLRDLNLLSQGLVQTGIALYDLKRFAEARGKAVGALRLAPRSAWRTRTAAWIQLGNLANERGQLRAAIGKLNRAKRHCHGSDCLVGFVYWREAAVLGRMGRIVAAGQAYREAIRIFEKVGQGLDVAFVAVDLAEMLISAGRLAETLTLARALTPRFENLGNHPFAASLWMDLLALILQGSRDGLLAQILNLRAVLKKADPRIRLEANG